MVRIGQPQERRLCLSEGEREELERIGRSHSISHSVVRRAQIVLASADGETNTAIAHRLGTTNPTICHWRKRWFEQGLVGLYGEARPGRPRTHDEEKVATAAYGSRQQARRRHPLDNTLRSGGDRSVQNHCGTHVDIVWCSAASLEKFQDLDRSTFC